MERFRALFKLIQITFKKKKKENNFQMYFNNRNHCFKEINLSLKCKC